MYLKGHPPGPAPGPTPRTREALTIYLERCRIWRRLRWRRRVLFFFHFHRNLARDFLYGLDLCAIPGKPVGDVGPKREDGSGSARANDFG